MKFIKTISYFVVIIFIIMQFVTITFVPDNSMGGNYPAGSWMLVKKTDGKVVNAITFFHGYENGDVVCFNSSDGSEHMQRIIGVPGDEVEITNGYVYIGQKKILEKYVQDRDSYNSYPAVVPDGSYFIMADRRSGSRDSRLFGYITSGQIWGKVLFKLRPNPAFYVPGKDM